MRQVAALCAFLLPLPCLAETASPSLFREIDPQGAIGPGLSPLLAETAAADLFLAPPSDAGVEPEAACLRAIFRAEEAHAIPENRLLRFSLAGPPAGPPSVYGLWPWRFETEAGVEAFEDRESMQRALRAVTGPVLRLGCAWALATEGAPEGNLAGDPTANAQAAAADLARLAADSGSWDKAMMLYGPPTEVFRTRLERIGELLPGLLVDLERRASGAKPELPELPALSSPEVQAGFDMPGTGEIPDATEKADPPPLAPPGPADAGAASLWSGSGGAADLFRRAMAGPDEAAMSERSE